MEYDDLQNTEPQYVIENRQKQNKTKQKMKKIVFGTDASKQIPRVGTGVASPLLLPTL